MIKKVKKMRKYFASVLAVFVMTSVPNIANAQNYQNWQNDPAILGELYMCTWQMDALYSEMPAQDARELMKTSKVDLVRASMAIVSAAQQNNIPLDPDQFKNMAVGKNQFLRQKKALWYDMLSCGAALARSGF